MIIFHLYKKILIIFYFFVFINLIELKSSINLNNLEKEDKEYIEKDIFSEWKEEKYRLNRFLTIIHEMHHAIEGGLKYAIKNKLDPEMHIIHPHKKITISFCTAATIGKIIHKKSNKNNNNKNILFVLKTILAGYASEKVFIKDSLMLQYFINNTPSDSFISLYLHGEQRGKSLDDIKNALVWVEKINYEDKSIKKIFKSHKKEFIEIKKISKNNENIKKNFNKFWLLESLYSDLVSKYSKKKHMNKIYKIFSKNKLLFAYELLFFKDIKSIWSNNKFIRDPNNPKQRTEYENKVSTEYENKYIIYNPKKFNFLKKLYSIDRNFMFFLKKGIIEAIPYFIFGVTAYFMYKYKNKLSIIN